MARTFLAFLAGVVLTCIAFILFIDQPEPASTKVLRAESAGPSSDATEMNADAGSSPDNGRGEIRIEPAAEEGQESDSNSEYMELARLSTGEVIDLLRSLSLEQVEALASMDRVAHYAEQDLRRRDDIERVANMEPPTYPITLPAEFSNWFAEEPNLIHEALQRQPFDPSWSPQAEAELHAYFSEQPQIFDTYGIPTITCRTGACEVAFVAHGIDNSERANQPNALTADAYTDFDFRAANSEFWERDAVAELFRMSVPSVNTEDGTTTILWIIQRSRLSSAEVGAGTGTNRRRPSPSRQ